jgi:hypothetical protein
VLVYQRVMGIVRYSLVGGAISPSWKMMERKSMGFGWHPIYDMENNPFMFETANQMRLNAGTF